MSETWNGPNSRNTGDGSPNDGSNGAPNGASKGAPNGAGSHGSHATGAGALSVLLILEDEANRRATRAAVDGLPGIKVIGDRADLRSGLLLARQLRPRIVLLDLPVGYEEALTAAGNFKLDSPESALFLLSNSLDPQLLLRAIRAGAQEVLKKPVDRALLQEAIERVSRSGAARSAGVTQARSIITVFSNKGGVGVTTIAANLAVALKTQFEVGTVALVDFDQASGDSANVMGLKAERSIADLLRLQRLDSAALHMNLLRHVSGVSVLAQPDDLGQSEPITPAQAAEILDSLSSSFEAVVVDAPHSFDEVSLELFDRSSTILVLVELSIPSIRAARRALDVFDRLHYTSVPGRVRVIVNRYAGGREFITLDQLQETLGVRAFATIENDYRRVFASVNSGRPFCLDDPESAAARDLSALAAKLLNRDTPVKPEDRPARRGIFGRMVSR
jgi:pilus assembly protein CpaE